MQPGIAFLLLAVAVSACSRGPTYGQPTPRDTTAADDPPPPKSAGSDEPMKNGEQALSGRGGGRR
jgi:hypothetical protein